MFIKILIIIVFILVGTLYGFSQSLSNKAITLISVEEKDKLLSLKDVQLIDVRTPTEYQSGHIHNAQNIDYNSSTFNEDIKYLEADKPVVLYCQKGGRSAKSAKKMHKLGFKEIYDLKGGFLKWKSENLDLNLSN